MVSRLKDDTRLDGRDGRFRANLHEDWQIWFPNGGYMATVLLRAVGEASQFHRPVSHTCYFLSVPEIGPVDIQVTSVKKTRNAEALAFSMTQDNKPIIQGMAWTGQPVEGYSHDDAQMPKVAGYDQLKSTAEIDGAHPEQAFWHHFEQRPISQDVHWQQTVPGVAMQQDWLAFKDEPDEDPFLSAGRFVVLLDSYGWPAAARAHSGDGRFIAPTLSLTVDFHRSYAGRWMLSEATAPIADDGYMQVRSRLWAEEGPLLASAQAMLICRPRPGFSQ